MINDLFNSSGRFEYENSSYPHHDLVRNYFKIVSPNKSNEYFYNKIKTVWGNLFSLTLEEFNDEIEKINKRIEHDNFNNIKKAFRLYPFISQKLNLKIT